MSSHREAPEISKDPVADSTDLYAFVSPDDPDTVTLIANYIPLEGPDGGPNFYSFGDDVLYEILIDNNGDSEPDITFQFKFKSVFTSPNSFLYNTGPIESLDSPNWNFRQFYSVSVLVGSDKPRQLGSDLPCPPCRIGPLSTHLYPELANAAIQALPGGMKVFAGQRAEGFYVDLGAIFDLGDLRPFEQLHNTFGQTLPILANPALGVNSTAHVNVHSIAIQVPAAYLTANGKPPTDPTNQMSTIGVWTTASRQQAQVRSSGSNSVDWAGPYVQVSRLGNPLVNEVVIPIGMKDFWNTQPPVYDKQFESYVANPELSGLLPVLYPGVFPNLAAFNASGTARADLEAILLTGIPAGIIPGFQNYTGPTPADVLRLNMAIPPTTSKPSNLGLIGGDAAGYPNGRRVFDDVVTIDLRAFAGVTLPLVDPSYTPDGAAGLVTDGLTANAGDLTAKGTENYLPVFPYLGHPHSGFVNPD
ncbi:MAG: DUF4331 domain-containing protein [Acidimicrobiales bacterium]